jgi:hypothetical protein
VIAENGARPKRNLASAPGARWRRPLFLSTIGLVCFLWLSENGALRPAGDSVGDGVARRVREDANRLPGPTAGDIPPNEGHRSPAHLRRIDALLRHVKKTNAITADEAESITRMLRDLQMKGSAAVPAIGDFLRDGKDVDFASMRGGERVGHRTLRQAVIETLGKIGGRAAVAVSLEQLQRTADPIEIVLLARSLDGEEPGLHRAEVLRTIGDVLEGAAHADAREAPDVSPLFDLLRTYGGDEAVGILERSVPRWGEYALIALASLSDGAGLSSVVAIADGAGAAVANPALPFQILAQSAVQYPDAGNALVALARAGQIPEDVWGAMSEALEGKELRFPGTMFDGTPLVENATRPSNGPSSRWKTYYIEWLNVRYEQDVAAAEWSTEQIDQQLALIDDLRDVASTPTAVRALQQARAALQRLRHDDERSIPEG